MHTEFFQNLISNYKEHFVDIRRHEMYKWTAIQWFQDHWEPYSVDFAAMLSTALSKTSNLMDSGNYFPRRMIVKYAEREPHIVKQLFIDLYNEDNYFVERILEFQTGIRAIHNIHYPGRADYQDHRAIMVYLCLRSPDRYFLYKFDMYKAYSLLLNDHSRPIMGRTDNVIRFTYLSEMLLGEVEKDNELIRLHQKYLRDNDYSDTNLHVLTQDIIYAATKHLANIAPAYDQPIKIDVLDLPLLLAPIPKPKLKGSLIDFDNKSKQNRNTGNIGESMIFDLEFRKLANTHYRPRHDSKEIGDGLGYDIKSFTEKGEPMFIEVKSTYGSYKTPFFITASELLKSQIEGDKYYLYRLFDITPKSSKLIIHKGPLDSLCKQPVNYIVRVTG